MRDQGLTGWGERAYAELAARGHRAGGARAAVIDLLDESGGCLTALEIVDRLRGTAATASVYRALAALEEAGLVRGFDVGEGAARYELVDAPGAHHHHHVVCDRCGRTDTFDDPALEAALRNAAEATAYRVHGHDLVLRGLCPACDPENPA